MIDENAETVQMAGPDEDKPDPIGASSKVRVDLGAMSHIGKVRPNNEDHHLAARFDRSMHTLLTNLPAGAIPKLMSETVYGLAVADGMGGEAAGEIASRTALSTMIDLVLQTPDWIMYHDKELARRVQLRMEDRFQRIRDVLEERARADPSLFGMGTTMTIACSLGAHLIVAHVGDSRVYLFRAGRLTRLTHDQTAVQSLVDLGLLSPEQAASHPLRHRLFGALSTKIREIRVEFRSLLLADGDKLLLCTDGLTDMVPDAAITEVLRRDESAADACRALIDQALAQGGKDNVTVVLAHYQIPL